MRLYADDPNHGPRTNNYDDRRGGHDDRRGGHERNYDDRRGGSHDRDNYRTQRGGRDGGDYAERPKNPVPDQPPYKVHRLPLCYISRLNALLTIHPTEHTRTHRSSWATSRSA